MRQRLFCLIFTLLAGALAVPSVLPAMAAPGGGPGSVAFEAISASQYSPDSEECDMLARINAYRKANGKSALKLSRTLGAAAEHHSREMAQYNYFSHTMRNGVSWSDNITNHGYPTNTYRAENLAVGNAADSRTFEQWKNSSGHNANMLNGNFKAIGIGRAYNAESKFGWYWTTTFGGVTSQTISC